MSEDPEQPAVPGPGRPRLTAAEVGALAMGAALVLLLLGTLIAGVLHRL